MDNKVIGIEVECECGNKHTFPIDEVFRYVSSGCDSCGYGSGTDYSWSCPVLGRSVSYSDDTY
jgi:hypothetical protein